MLIKNFITELTNILQYDDTDLRTFIRKTALPSATEKVLQFLKYHEKEFTCTVGSDLKVNLPADVFSISEVYLNDEEIPRTTNPDPDDEDNDCYFLTSEYETADFATALSLLSVPSANIPHLRSREEDGYYFEILDTSANVLGTIYDNANIYYKEDDLSAAAQITLHIKDDGDTIRIKAGDILELDVGYGIMSIQFPAITTETTYYLAEDGSLYSDSTLTTLVKRNPNKLKVRKLLVRGLEATDEVVIRYLARPQRHISLYDDDEYLDLYKRAIMYFVLAECYGYMKKYADKKVSEEDGNNELLRLKRETSFAKEKGIDRRLGRVKPQKPTVVYYP